MKAASRCFSVLFILLPMFLLPAADYHLVKDAKDWSAPASYAENQRPPAGSDIFIPTNGAMTVSTDAEYEFLNTMNAIRPFRGSKLTAVVAGGVTQTLSCAVYVSHDSSAWEVGTIVKEGEGALKLTSPGKVAGPYNELSDYNVNISVDGGTLDVFDVAGLGNNIRLFRDVKVAEDAVFSLPGTGSVSMWSLNGYGTVTNAGTSAKNLSITSSNGGRSQFYGKIAGAFDVTVTGGACLHGTENSFSTITVREYGGNIAGYKGVLGVASFGGKGETSSIGTTDYLTLGYNGESKGNAHLLYLGEGETVTKIFGINQTDRSPFTMDAGAWGGLEFTALWRNWSTSGHIAIVLTGSNVNECTVGTGIFEVKAGTRDNILKRGTGTWKFTKTGNDSNLGSIGVEDGTLSFDSIDNRYVLTALGTSKSLYGAGFTGAASGKSEVPYAFELGGADGTPVFEYVGSTPGYACDRPIALTGGEAHLRSSGGGPLKMRGAWMPVAGEATFVLDGDNAQDNVFSSISNGLGTVSVVKDGSGTWTLSGAQDFSGTLEVKAGVLKLRNKANYEWYRFLVKENYGTKAGISVQNEVSCKGLALYDASGSRIGTNLAHVADFRLMESGQSAYGTLLPVTTFQADKFTWRYTTEWLSSAKNWYDYVDAAGVDKDDYSGWTVKSPIADFISRDDPSTWIPVVFRLTNGSPEVVGCDIAHKYYAGYGSWASRTMISSFELQGSSDGLDWRTLVDVVDCTGVTANDRWAKTDAVTWMKQMQKLSNVETESFYFGDSKSRTASTFLSRVSAVKVARGASLEVEEGSVSLGSGMTLCIDCEGEGVATISGISLPAEGTLEVVGGGEGEIRLPVRFVNDETYLNIGRWNLVLNGKPYKGGVRCENGALTLLPVGFSVIVR